MPLEWTDAFLSLGVGLGLAAAVGLRVFVPLLMLGLAGRYGGLPLADGFAWVASGPAVAAFSVATALEVLAYYVPWLDNALDIVAGPMAVGAGILVTAAVGTDFPPMVRWSTAIIAGGGTAAAVQGLTSLARLKSTATTAGAANPILATFELFGAIVTSFVAIVLPVLALVVVLTIILLVSRIAKKFLGRKPSPA